MPNKYETLEAAQARILELEEERATLIGERDTARQNEQTLTANVEELRKLNQTYFNRLIAQDKREEEDEEEDEAAPTCEEFAASLKI